MQTGYGGPSRSHFHHSLGIIKFLLPFQNIDFFFFSWLGVSRRWKVPPSPQSLAFHNFQHTASLAGAAGYCAQWDPLSSLSSGACTPQGRHGCLEWPLSLGTIRALLPPPLFIISHISPMTGSKKTRRGSVPQISIFLPSTQ